MSAPDENWGGDGSTISSPSQATEAAVVGEEDAIIFDIDKLEKAREADGVTMVGTPSSEAATVQLNPQEDPAPKPRHFVQHNTSEDPALEPQNYNDHFSSNPHRNINPTVNTQERYHRDRPKITAEDNVTSRFELFLLGDGEKKVTEAPDTRIPSSSIFTFNKEDHTLGNLLRSRLLQSTHVTFAGYRVPHPLFSKFELRIQTDGTVTPRAALVQACRDLVNDLGVLGREFTKEWELRKMVGEGVNGAGGE
ncbi:DNA-directed RNA polymerase II core subunit [Hypocenomyce scalaris]|nr:DNA-directed RNA polymerase II core subunit [Hypocenomyce scalaris]